MNINALKTELDVGHPDTGAYNVDDALAAAELNAVNRTILRAVSMTELREWAAEDARAFNIFQGITSGGTGNVDQIRNLCLIMDRLLGTDDGELDPSNAAHVGLINQLVTAEILSAADRTALVAKATDDVSRAVEIGLGAVKHGHVQMARLV